MGKYLVTIGFMLQQNAVSTYWLPKKVQLEKVYSDTSTQTLVIPVHNYSFYRISLDHLYLHLGCTDCLHTLLFVL